MAPAWKANLPDTRARAEQLLVSGEVLWGLDENHEIFALYGVPSQPVVFLIASDRTVVNAWFGERGEEFLRAELDNLLAVSG